MEHERRNQIATTILDQLKSNPREVFAWGSKEFSSTERSVDGKTHPALQFSIRTPKIPQNGKVIISLDESKDMYIVEALTVKGGTETVIGIEKDIYFDQLHDIVNSLIEDKETMHQGFF